MTNILLSPPITFGIILAVVFIFNYSVSHLQAQGKYHERKYEPYSGGQRNIDHNVSPDYSQFYPFAFFFTIMHVLVLVVATAPSGDMTLPLLYMGAAVLALIIIFRK